MLSHRTGLPAPLPAGHRHLLGAGAAPEPGAAPRGWGRAEAGPRTPGAPRGSPRSPHGHGWRGGRGAPRCSAGTARRHVPPPIDPIRERCFRAACSGTHGWAPGEPRVFFARRVAAAAGGGREHRWCREHPGGSGRARSSVFWSCRAPGAGCHREPGVTGSRGSPGSRCHREPAVTGSRRSQHLPRSGGRGCARTPPRHARLFAGPGKHYQIVTSSHTIIS